MSCYKINVKTQKLKFLDHPISNNQINSIVWFFSFRGLLISTRKPLQHEILYTLYNMLLKKKTTAHIREYNIPQHVTVKRYESI